MNELEVLEWCSAVSDETDMFLAAENEMTWKIRSGHGKSGEIQYIEMADNVSRDVVAAAGCMCIQAVPFSRMMASNFSATSILRGYGMP